ncbi:hypothetical protein L7F22_051377 [Adiantum nelumboides]|nr:hypothetical protein [Adiantum nelumboides]
MTDLFQEGLDNFVLVFFDDILVYSKTREEHEQHLHQVLEILTTVKLYAKRSKCLFFVEKVAYLGFIVSKDGISPDPAKVEAVVKWPIPQSISEVRGFLGLTGQLTETHLAAISNIASTVPSVSTQDGTIQRSNMNILQDHRDGSIIVGAKASFEKRDTQEVYGDETFHCRRGKAYLYNSVVNVIVGDYEERMMTTGVHVVADIYCIHCNQNVGWRYETAYEDSQKYKEGKFILERARIDGSCEHQHSQPPPDTDIPN